MILIFAIFSVEFPVNLVTAEFSLVSFLSFYCVWLLCACIIA